MPFLTSPGVSISEVDLTTVVPAVSTTTGGFAGVFRWGPILTPTLISNESNLVTRFGAPVANTTYKNTETFFTAADFLSYSNALYVVRANQGNTAAPTTGSIASNIGFAAKYPGDLGNSLRLLATDLAAWTANTAAAQLVSAVYGAPDSGNIHVAVVDITGGFTGTANTILELYQNMSLTQGARNDDGTNNYFAEVINTGSSYIAIPTANAAAFIANTAFTQDCVLGTNGADEDAVTVGALETAFDTMKEKEQIDISLLMQGVARGTGNATELLNYLKGIAETRQDCIVFGSPNRTAVTGTTQLTSVSTWADSVASSSYVVLDSGYKYRYNRYADTYIYTPLNGDIAGLCARTDDMKDAWWSPAGYSRGVIKNAIKLAYNPGQTDRDALYKKRINSVVTIPGQGTLLFGDKTALSKPSAFDRINVRRLFIVLEKAIGSAAKFLLFEFNDDFTRAQFKNMVEPFLRDVQGRRGIYDYKVVCDETNNTSQVIDSNQFVGDIYIKPARSINAIQLNFIAVGTGVEFNEIIGQK